LSFPADTPELDPAELADLSALADGTLDPSRRPEVQGRIDSSPQLRALYERERQVVEILHEARNADRAPAGLRARIEAQRPSPARRVRRRFAYGGAVAGALAAVITALALLIPAGSAVAPSVSQAAALAVRGIAAPPPPPDPDAPLVRLDKNIEQVYFPNWRFKFDWRAVGQRSDRINGRRAETVYYQWMDKQIAYTIVAAPKLEAPPVSVKWVDGTLVQTMRLGGRTVVSWRRGNHTCVLSGAGVPAAELQKLAAWQTPPRA
jgi:anti-sigma factor RsiW